MVDGRDTEFTDEFLRRLTVGMRFYESGIDFERERVLALIDQERKRCAITPRAIGWERALVKIKGLVEQEAGK